MGTAIGVIIVFLVALIIVGKLLASINKSIQKIQKKDRCVECKSRLKAVNGVYATTCAKCGSRQPWAPAA